MNGTIFLWLALLATPAIAQPGGEAQRLSEHIRTLSSDAFEGRAPVTPGEDRTVDYLIGQFKAVGLAPGAPDGGWTQDVPLLRAEIVGPPRLAVDVAGARRDLTQGREIAVRAAATGQERVTLDAAPLVFVGYGVTAPERDWDDFKGVDLAGKIMVVLVNDPDFETGEGDFGGRAMTYYGRWTYKFEEAARRGAAGVLVIHEDAPAAYGWATVRNSNTGPLFDIVRPEPAAHAVPFEGWIQRDLAVDLFKASGLDFEAMKAAARRRDFHPMPLGAALSADYMVKSEILTSRNVVGKVVGASRPDEVVIYSAHWDHLGVGEPDARGDRIYNGAVDNATGTAALIEMARAFAAGSRPARTVLFLALTAEEQGLLGSEYYAEKPLYPLGRTVGVLNMDALGVDGPTRNFTISGSARLGLLDLLTEEAKARGRDYAPDPHPEAGYFFRSDHFSFAKRGVPAISFDPGDDLVTGGRARGEAVAAAYRADRYHQPADEWRADWDLTGLVQDVALLKAVGDRLANGADWPNWAEGSEFRPIRDQSAAERGR